jgi:PPM family protein phosphatase
MFWKKKNKHVYDNPATEHTDLKVVIKTDLGNIRTNNEDAASYHRIAEGLNGHERGLLLIVADGMGGHQAGEVASKMAVDVVNEEYYHMPGQSFEKMLLNAFQSANRKIYQLASSDEKYKGMGTTCTALVVAGRSVYFAHAGDSRAYLLKRNSLIRITEDHTYVQELVSKGDITSLEADTHPQRNILTNAMGTKPGLRVDTGICNVPIDPGDRLLLCSDGLYDYLNDSEIAAVLGGQTLRDAAEYFISEAKKRGGHDNITVVLAESAEVQNAENLKSTREIVIPKLTRDADLPG